MAIEAGVVTVQRAVDGVDIRRAVSKDRDVQSATETGRSAVSDGRRSAAVDGGKNMSNAASCQNAAGTRRDALR